MHPSHAAALTTWKQQKAASEATTPKPKANPKSDTTPQAETAPKPAKYDPKTEAKQGPLPEPKGGPEAAPMEVDVSAQPLAKPRV